MYTPGRPLNHSNPGVRATVKQFLHRLKAEGFRGWRYDMANGLPGDCVGDYNDATGLEFSIGEFFDDDRQKVTNWIDRTGGRSAAFDFPARLPPVPSLHDKRLQVSALRQRESRAAWRPCRLLALSRSDNCG
jgi:hypothetical protein